MGFDKDNPLGRTASAEYRQYVINPGATKPTAQLVRHFVRRPQTMEAFKAWLNEEFK